MESEFQFLDFSTAEFEKKIPTRIFGIKNGIRIPLWMGVPEIGTKNQNSQPSPVDATSQLDEGILCVFSTGKKLGYGKIFSSFVERKWA